MGVARPEGEPLAVASQAVFPAPEQRLSCRQFRYDIGSVVAELIEGRIGQIEPGDKGQD